MLWCRDPFFFSSVRFRAREDPPKKLYTFDVIPVHPSNFLKTVVSGQWDLSAPVVSQRSLEQPTGFGHCLSLLLKSGW
jgi:hypothetical protein